MRMNNPADMTVCEILEKVKEETCGDLCKYYQNALNKCDEISTPDHRLQEEELRIIREELNLYCEDCILKRL